MIAIVLGSQAMWGEDNTIRRWCACIDQNAITRRPWLVVVARDRRWTSRSARPGAVPM